MGGVKFLPKKYNIQIKKTKLENYLYILLWVINVNISRYNYYFITILILLSSTIFLRYTVKNSNVKKNLLFFTIFVPHKYEPWRMTTNKKVCFRLVSCSMKCYATSIALTLLDQSSRNNNFSFVISVKWSSVLSQKNIQKTCNFFYLKRFLSEF